MFLKSLEVRGFKSFADKTELSFKKGVTAVVGPNGSGKSNISDSVRWVLGEQSVKSLRGGKMEDVIFAGTQFRKPVGLAQVSLTLDNTDGSLSTEYNEVTVTRRIFRSGETEYLINNHKCRLKDITELFMDTGIGKEGYSLIGQGKIDAILSGKPDERRALFEEAAGIVKFKSRKEEAEKKLENTDSNLIRIRDIISTYEERLEPLKKEKEKALKYKELDQDLKIKEVSLLVYNINKLNKDMEQIKIEISKNQHKINEKRDKLNNHKNNIEELENRIEELDKKNTAEKEEYYREKEVIAQTNSDLELYKERISNYKFLIEKEDKEIEEISKKLEIIIAEKDHILKEIELKESELKGKRDSLGDIEKERMLLESSINHINVGLNKLKGKEFELLSKHSDITNAINSIKKDMELREENLKSLDKRLDNEDSNLAINIGTVENIKENNGEIEESIKSLNNLIVHMKKELSKNYSKLSNEEKDLNNITKNINQFEANHNMLVNLEKHYDGYNRAAKILKEHVVANRVEGIKDIRLVGEIFQIDKNFEVALEIALGASISNIITKDEKDAKGLINYLKSRKLGRATFLPMTTVNGKKLEVPNNIKNTKGYLGIASDLIKYHMNYTGIVQYILGRTIIAEDMDAALAISAMGRHSYKIVTLTGEVINPGGALTGGSIQGKSSNLLGRKREIEELAKKIEVLKKDFGDKKVELENVKVSIKQLDDDILNKRDEIHQKNIDLSLGQNEIKNLINDGERLKKSIEVTKLDIINTKDSLKRLSDKLDNKTLELDSLDQKNIERREDLKSSEKELEDKKLFLEELKEKAMSIKIELAKYEEYVSGQKKQLLSKESDINDNKNKKTALSIEVKTKNENIIELNGKIDNGKEKIVALEVKVKELEERFIIDETKKIKAKEDLKKEENICNELENFIRVEENELNRRSIQSAKLESEQETLYSKLNDEINITFAEALEIALEIENLTEIKEQISKLKFKISSLGTVNLASIVEFDEVLEKYEFMSTQELDLQKAKDELLGLILDMTAKMQEMFKDNFKILNENFSETFKELFGGGTAELILAEGDELSANIVINVQPPGKKLQNINLMSGGEKVLSAIAILFAILKMKPTPFCILDEIEAALDDANVFRYAEFLKKFSKNIQFIVITHRKGTMEASDVMYGVTMEEKGVSKVVSVDLTKN